MSSRRVVILDVVAVGGDDKGDKNDGWKSDYWTCVGPFAVFALMWYPTDPVWLIDVYFETRFAQHGVPCLISLLVLPSDQLKGRRYDQKHVPESWFASGSHVYALLWWRSGCGWADSAHKSNRCWWWCSYRELVAFCKGDVDDMAMSAQLYARVGPYLTSGNRIAVAGIQRVQSHGHNWVRCLDRWGKSF